jgi:hypothetical protein
VHATIRRGLPPSPFVQRFRLLQYFQFIHGGLRKGGLLSYFESISPKYTPLGTMPIGQGGGKLKFEISDFQYLKVPKGRHTVAHRASGGKMRRP